MTNQIKISNEPTYLVIQVLKVPKGEIEEKGYPAGWDSVRYSRHDKKYHFYKYGTL